MLDADLSGVLEFEEMILSVMKVGVTSWRGTNVVLPPSPVCLFPEKKKQSKFGIVYHVCFNHVYSLCFFM